MSKPQRQRIAAYGVLTYSDQILLVRASSRSDAPDTWWLPGGGVDFGEHPRECVVREFLEETGLNVACGELLDVVSDVMDWPHVRESVHTVRLLYAVTHVDGTLRGEANGTTDAVEWRPLEDASGLPLMPFVRDALSRIGRRDPQKKFLSTNGF
ncbi:MAG: 8-oxo-dGTP diphosphatase [Actinomycetota bacterium]|nr:8-oxo-dGTP diphosphatase [Actinomycetota bacterium]